MLKNSDAGRALRGVEWLWETPEAIGFSSESQGEVMVSKEDGRCTCTSAQFGGHYTEEGQREDGGGWCKHQLAAKLGQPCWECKRTLFQRENWWCGPYYDCVNDSCSKSEGAEREVVLKRRKHFAAQSRAAAA